MQQAARGNRDKALEIAQMKKDLQAIEAELQLRRSAGDAMGVHLKRMFGI